MGRCSLADLLLAGLRLGRSHHHGVLQQVPQQLFQVGPGRSQHKMPLWRFNNLIFYRGTEILDHLRLESLKAGRSLWRSLFISGLGTEPSSQPAPREQYRSLRRPGQGLLSAGSKHRGALLSFLLCYWLPSDCEAGVCWPLQAFCRLCLFLRSAFLVLKYFIACLQKVLQKAFILNPSVQLYVAACWHEKCRTMTSDAL